MSNLTEIRSDFSACVRDARGGELRAARNITTVQVNIGLKCNLICRHCHVNSSPSRTETMTWSTMEAVLRVAEELGAHTIDITGGAPEMHPDCQRFVRAAREKGFEVILRTNLTILLEPGYEDFIDFFKEQRVHLVASLPCYLEENVDAQRGEGVYRESIEAIRRLNAAGYGIDAALPMNLVYNPGGPSLPPGQASLEADYQRKLHERFGIRFTHLHTITNVPIGRFRGDLRKDGRLDTYLQLLRDAFNPDTVEPLMCRHQISVGWDGVLYDCDFNLALRWAAQADAPNISDVDPATLAERKIVTGDHCFACTAGTGSSCCGALVEASWGNNMQRNEIRHHALRCATLAALWVMAACAPAQEEPVPDVATTETQRNMTAFSYDGYNDLLKAYVDDKGMVNYEALKANRKALDAFNATLAALSPEVYESWPEAERIAFWVNAYNSITLQRIVDHYPIKKGNLINSLRYPENSIRQISGVWEKLTNVVMGEAITLDSIEHKILRVQFKEPRIHAAIVCAAQSCPPLRNEAYRSETLDAQLADNSRDFLSHSGKFRIDLKKKRVYVSPIFDWFGEDFVGLYNADSAISDHGNTQDAFLEFISRHVSDDDRAFLLKEKYKVEYLDYDWSLNEQTP